MIEIDKILDVEQHLDGIEAVIFDLDDTLYSERDYVKSGYHVIADAFAEIPTIFDELWEEFKRNEPAIDVVFERHNILSRKDEALRIYRYQKPNISLYPGVREMLDRIARTKKLGIITDGRPEGQHAKLEALGLTDIPCIITDELGGVQFRKPCEKAFFLMCKQFNVKYGKSVYIGDNINKDFIASDKLGINDIYFCNADGLYYSNKQLQLDR